MNGLKAGEATTAAARILIEEMLGFHTVTSQSAGDFFQKLLQLAVDSVADVLIVDHEKHTFFVCIRYHISTQL